MSEQKGRYSLVQFCPDPSRLEGINIGVVVYSTETGRLEYRLTHSNQRIRRMFGPQDWSFLDRVRASLESSLQLETFATVKDLESYIARRANVIQLTPLRPVKLGEISQDVSALFRRLVDRETLPRATRIATHLKQTLFEAGVGELVERSISVQIPNFEPIRVPYGYRNGRYNLISPVQFNPNREDVLGKAGKNAIEGQMLFENPDPERGLLRLVVVAKFTEGNNLSSRETIAKIFAEHQVQMHTFENIGPLVADIRQSAREHAG